MCELVEILTRTPTKPYHPALCLMGSPASAASGGMAFSPSGSILRADGVEYPVDTAILLRGHEDRIRGFLIVVPKESACGPCI